MSRITTALTAGLVFLTLVTIGSSYQTYLLCQKTESFGAKVDEHMDDIYFLMKSDSSRLYTIMDTEVRILHYAKPHKHAMWACPECAEQKDREKIDAKKEIQDQSRHQHSAEGVRETGSG